MERGEQNLRSAVALYLLPYSVEPMMFEFSDSYRERGKCDFIRRKDGLEALMRLI